MIFPMLRISITGVGLIASICVSWTPLVSPVTTILMVANFRRRALYYMLFFNKSLQRLIGRDSHRSATAGASSGVVTTLAQGSSTKNFSHIIR